MGRRRGGGLCGGVGRARPPVAVGIGLTVFGGGSDAGGGNRSAVVTDRLATDRIDFTSEGAWQPTGAPAGAGSAAGGRPPGPAAPARLAPARIAFTSGGTWQPNGAQLGAVIAALGLPAASDL